ncbi:MAG: hypothetical protein B7733_05200 [Myxococcales bacterium FL481]|nr:MAG: hypothetical protein B7733_05200 [Myxococcales bacterium FL481]
MFAIRLNSVPFVLALAAGVGSLGCEDDTGPGSLVVPVILGNNKSCEELGITSLHAELGEEGEYQEIAPCDDPNPEIVFEDIPAGRYRLFVAGRDAEGVATLDSGADPDRRVEILGDGATIREENPVLLTEAPAHVWTRWSFDFGSCESAGMAAFRIAVFEQGGVRQLLDETVACNVERDASTQFYYRLPDPSRILNGRTVGEISVQPLDRAGIVMGPPVGFTFPPPGPGRDIRLSLVGCTNTGCTGSGTPDP